tara:strand:+ start:422 stop:1315 length:894 start_codon:yes stop_codon:yes gene_type:complete
MKKKYIFNKVIIFGIGLIGGSFALALKKVNSVKEIIGFDKDKEVLKIANNIGIIDVISENLSQEIYQADLIFISVPVGQTFSVFKLIKPHLNNNSVITDVGSTKLDIVNGARDILGEKISLYVPGHPIAGNEKNGPESAIPELFFEKKIIITPLKENSKKKINLVERAWKLCGGINFRLSLEKHDSIFASVSHLPHLLAFILVEDFATRINSDELFSYAASGFKDFTRIASSSPEMWRDISMSNKEALIKEIDQFSKKLSIFKDNLCCDNKEEIKLIFSTAQKARKLWESSIHLKKK